MQHTSSPYSLNVIKCLQDDVSLSDYIRMLMTMRPGDARSIIGRTTISAYRRVHEILSSIIDRIHDDLNNNKKQSIHLVELSRGLILVSYQEARGQIHKRLASDLKNILEYAIDQLKQSSREPKDLAKIFSRIRILLDTYAVLVYTYGRR